MRQTDLFKNKVTLYALRLSFLRKKMEGCLHEQAI